MYNSIELLKLDPWLFVDNIESHICMVTGRKTFAAGVRTAYWVSNRCGRIFV